MVKGKFYAVTEIEIDLYTLIKQSVLSNMTVTCMHIYWDWKLSRDIPFV